MSIWVSLFKVVAHEVVSAMCREGVKSGVNYCMRRTAGGGGMNADGTPDKKFTQQGPTKADGTLDMRYKCNW